MSNLPPSGTKDQPGRRAGGLAAPAGTWSMGIASPARRRVDLLSLVPLLAIIALVAMVSALVWLVARDDIEKARTKIATDALWVEQTLRFQLGVDEDMLVRLALDHAGGVPDEVIAARARSHVASNPEVLSILWYDAQGGVGSVVSGIGSAADPALAEQLITHPLAEIRPAYGNVGKDGLVTLGVPLANGQGAITATISLPRVLERHLPWWIAEQYGVMLVDLSGNILASRQRLPHDPENPQHIISFDPPLRGTWVQIGAYTSPSAFSATALFGAIAALAAFAVLALGVLYRSSKRRRETEMRLLTETAFRRSMEESLTVGLRAKDHEGRILFVNPAFCKLVGWEAAELIGRPPPMPYWDRSILTETQERHAQLAAGGAISQRFETRFVSRDGREIEIEVYEAPLIDAMGVHRGWMGSVIDITDARRAARHARQQDETLARTGRLVTLGEMASTQAHELNQPLSAIASYAAGMLNLIERQKADPAVLKGATEKLAHQADRAGQIIRRIQDLVKKRQPQFQLLDLTEVATESIGFLQADAREHRVSLRCQGVLRAPVAADRILIEQVLINLIRNGMEAMAASRSGDVVSVHLSEDADHVTLTVEDSGGGIPESLRASLFEAFASTKPQGMGMGLKICRSIIELHGGSLTWRDIDGGGTAFVVMLPRAKPGDDRTADDGKPQEGGQNVRID